MRMHAQTARLPRSAQHPGTSLRASPMSRPDLLPATIEGLTGSKQMQTGGMNGREKSFAGLCQLISKDSDSRPTGALTLYKRTSPR